MTYTDEQLETIERLASIYMPIRDIALILEVEDTQLREDIQCQSSPASRAYRKGKALSKVALHQQEMNLAKVGSPLALENARQNLLDMEDDE
ncbi:MAG: hypothetical protein IKN91_00200 [Paludibacteraceae bacterium]|nr:hypothetical protein [Paludibacteraceae bacterium]